MSNVPHGYSKIYNLGHPAVSMLTMENRKLRVEEKVDGSQFSFKLVEGEVYFRSKNKQIHIHEGGMFEKGVDHIMSKQDALVEGWTYRCEYLQKPKHNALPYNRVPHGWCILFDIEKEPYVPATRQEMFKAANDLDIELIPLLYEGTVGSTDQLLELMDAPSFLGNPGGMQMEGVVLKPASPDQIIWDRDKKILMGKYVSEAFKERNGVEWKANNPKKLDIITQLAEDLGTERAWEKAIEHLRDNGEIEDSPRDIGKLIREVQKDTLDENADEIKEVLFKWARKEISRKLTCGLPEWYKKRLLEKQFQTGS